MKAPRFTLDDLPKRLQAQAMAQMSKSAPPSPPPSRIRQRRRGKNKTEAAFEFWLREQHPERTIYYESFTFLLANGVRYTPDFVCFSEHRAMICYEVKGFMREDAAAKIKVAASRFPEVAFWLVTKQACNHWNLSLVLP